MLVLKFKIHCSDGLTYWNAGSCKRHNCLNERVYITNAENINTIKISHSAQTADLSFIEGSITLYGTLISLFVCGGGMYLYAYVYACGSGGFKVRQF